MKKTFSVLFSVLLAAAMASAATLTGKVTNLTTNKAAAGDEVALLNLSQGMSELARTKTDANGAFSFNIDDPNTPHLVRVTHDGVSYFPAGGPIKPGTSNVEVSVYDGANKVDGVSTTVNVVRVQADGGTLQVLELIAVSNGSKPPRTVTGDHTYEFYLPEGAHVDQMIAQAPGGMPVNTSPAPEGKSGKHVVNYALKPGETRLEIAYHMPYSGEATFAPKFTGNVQHFVVMMPKAMQFEAKTGSHFSPMSDDPNTTVQVATNVTPASDLAFRISGTGTLPDEQESAASQSASSGGGMAAAADNRPGGGLGAPIDSPDPLHKYRWMILGGLAVVLVSGGVFVVSRANQQNGGFAVQAGSGSEEAAKTSVASAAPASLAQVVPKERSSSMLLDALKEELFQLEVEKQQGRISPEDYEKAKAALEQTLRRALARQSS